MASKHGWPDRIGSFKRQARKLFARGPATEVMYKDGDKWASFQVSPDGEVYMELGDEPFISEGEGEFDSKEEAIAVVLQWSDMLEERS